MVDVSENELELWFNPQDRFAVSLRTPNGQLIGPIDPREFIENRRLADGSFISVYNELYHPANGANYMGIYLSPNLQSQPVIGVQAGRGPCGCTGARSATAATTVGSNETTHARSGDPERGRSGRFRRSSPRSRWSTTPRSARSAAGIGARPSRTWTRATTRSTSRAVRARPRDGRSKPDVAAPGTDIVAARRSPLTAKSWIGMTGTSMASPFVAGVAGLMLAIEPTLTAAQIEGIMRSTAKPLPGGSYTWVNDAGFGMIHPERCLEQAQLVNTHVDRTEE